jgi:Flp pilus assembly protein TadD
VLLAQGRFDDAERELSAALVQYNLRLEEDHEWRIPVLSDLGAVHTVRGSLDNAEEELLQAQEIAASATGAQASQERELIEERLTAIDR